MGEATKEDIVNVLKTVKETVFGVRPKMTIPPFFV